MATAEQNRQWRENSGVVRVNMDLPRAVVEKLDAIVELKKSVVEDYEENMGEVYLTDRKDYEAIKHIRGRSGVVSWLATAGSAWDFIVALESDLVDEHNSEVARGWKSYYDLHEVYLGLRSTEEGLEFKLARAEEKLADEEQVTKFQEARIEGLEALLDTAGIEHKDSLVQES